ncbi:hypothetical protein [Patulibacter sp.]|uniref:hypothetical protein n=1 Tax=Patulibacter sp. TaxID=1912859 RepID=UPI00271D0BB8|nr:hypothetical protein [Patulibacter sp.]MDO9409881.1 hypothetical protein [Patulibacter sp.]
MWVLHSVVGLLVVAVLAAAAWRLASRLRTDDPVVRGLAAVVWWWLGVQVSGLATLLPLGVGPGPVGAGAALALTVLVLRFVPRGTPTAAPDPATRTLLAVVGVGVVALCAVSLSAPVIGFDGLLYHLAVPAAWIGDGHLASLPGVVEGLPVEAYPVGTELTIGWLMTVVGSTAVALLVTPTALGVVALAVWTSVRRLGGTAAAGWGAVASTALALPFLAQASQVSTDLAGAAIMACGATIVLHAAAGRGTETATASAGAGPGEATEGAEAAARGRSRVSADVAGLLTGLVGLLLALGVKTTAACGGLLFLLLAWPARRELLGRLRAVPWWGLAVVVAGACGGVWLTRNLLLHGHPAWPLLSSPSGDPVPEILRPTVSRFVDHPGEVLRVGGTTYLDLAWVILPLFAIGLLAIVRGGLVRLVAVCGVLGALAWFVAPGTGTTSDPALAAGATRYLMPCWVLLAVAGWATLSRLAAGRPTWAPRALAGAAALVAVAQLVVARRYAADLPEGELVDLDRLPIEHGLTAALIAVVVLVVLVVAGSRAGRVLAPVFRPRVGAGLVVVAAVLVLVATPGLWDRHATTLETGRPPEPDDVVLALGATPAWALGAHGAPGSRLVADCEALRGGLAAGRVVTIGPGRPQDARCDLPGEPTEVDGFLVWTPPGS